MHKYVDRLLTLLPQEPKYFTPYGLATDFVGHPVIESPVVNGDGETFRRKYDIEDGQKIICLLPGSRHNEVSRLLPVFLQAAQILKQQHPELFFVIPTVKTVAQRVKAMLANAALPVLVVEGEEDRHNAMSASTAAIAASGTVALELAIADVPHVIGYKVAPLTAALVKHFLHIQFVNLSNILLGREIVPELCRNAALPPTSFFISTVSWNRTASTATKRKVLRKCGPSSVSADKSPAKTPPTSSSA